MNHGETILRFFVFSRARGSKIQDQLHSQSLWIPHTLISAYTFQHGDKHAALSPTAVLLVGASGFTPNPLSNGVVPDLPDRESRQCSAASREPPGFLFSSCGNNFGVYSRPYVQHFISAATSTYRFLACVNADLQMNFGGDLCQVDDEEILLELIPSPNEVSLVLVGVTGMVRCRASGCQCFL